MRARHGLRRRLMLMAAGVVGVLLVVEGLAWTSLGRLERSLGEVQAETLADVRRVLTLAESASSLATFAQGVAEIRDREALRVAERALEGRLEEFTALAAALPMPTGRPALPVPQPAIVRLADRLDGILRHLFMVTSEAIEAAGGRVVGEGAAADPRQRYLLAATLVAATEMSGLVKDYASLVERSDTERAEVLAANLRLGKMAAGLLGILVLVVALGFANAFLRGVVADLLGIAEAMRRLAAGDVSAHAPGAGRADEIGALARAFVVFKIQAREREEIERRLRHSERLEAVGRLTGGIAHDFNNLLTAVTTNVQLIHDGADLGSPARARALRALAAAEKGAAMVRHLLAFGRRQMLAPVATDVVALTNALADLVETSLGAGVTLVTRHAESDGTLVALVDPGQLETALINLAFNARDAIATRGTIVLATGRAPDGLVRIEVIDDGSGMDEVTLARIFEPFFTTKPAGAGSGLGLSMVYGFVRQSGGRIEVVSRRREGTVVTVDLPRADGPIEIAVEPPAPRIARPVVPQGLDILVVEDEAGVRNTIVDLLGTLGHRVRAAASGAEALRLFAEAPRVDLLLTDLALQNGMDGVELATTLRAMRPDLPVVIATGYAGAAAIDLPLLMKPFGPEDLEAAIARALAGG